MDHVQVFDYVHMFINSPFTIDFLVARRSKAYISFHLQMLLIDVHLCGLTLKDALKFSFMFLFLGKRVIH